MKRALLPLIVALLAAALQLVLYYERLPDSVASHFDGSGAADGWMPKATFVALYLGMLVLLALVLGGTSALASRLPDALINLPHKAYWLAPERRDDTIRTLRGTLDALYWGTMGFTVVLMQSVFTVNLQGEAARLSAATTWFVYGYIAWVFWLTGRLIFRFVRVPDRESGQRSQT